MLNYNFHLVFLLVPEVDWVHKQRKVLQELQRLHQGQNLEKGQIMAHEIIIIQKRLVKLPSPGTSRKKVNFKKSLLTISSKASIKMENEVYFV